jgi:predicted CXXCH cytochrome family protein
MAAVFPIARAAASPDLSLGPAINTNIPTAAPPTSPAGATMTSAQCAGCHVVDPAMSHPTAKIPSMTVPAALPLDRSRMSCTTCHLDSFEEHGHTAENPALLRNPGPQFCTQCHSSAEPTRQAQHPFALGKAHLVYPAIPGFRSKPKTVDDPDHDGVRSCLSCHDGTLASDAYLNVLNAPTFFVSTANVTAPRAIAGKDHPVGMTYPSVARTGDRALRPAPALDSRIRLTNNQVTCNSCHSLYTSERNLLSMSNRESALCTSCHSMQ